MMTLKKLREEKGMTQAELSKALKISPSAIGMYEQGRRVPDVATLKRMSAFFGVSIDYLLGNSSSRTPQGTRPKDLKDLNKFLQQSEIIFDGDTYNLTDEERAMVMQSLEVAFFAAKKANKRKQGGTPNNK